MNPQTDHVQMIGPWGYLGWLLAVCLGLLFYRQWTSDPHTALRKMRVELDEARKTIAQLRALEMKLKNRNDELNTQVNGLIADNQDLKTGMERMRVANDAMHEAMARMERHQKQLQDNHDELYKRVVAMQVKIDSYER